MDYFPQPIDLSEITLPPEISRLAETLARNTHEVWAAGRVAEGWQYGPHRDDAAKLHPGLVAYDQLSEAEKDYDRRTSANTLKLLLKLGYRITRD